MNTNPPPLDSSQNRLLTANVVLGILVVVVTATGIYAASQFPPEIDSDYARAVNREVQTRVELHSDEITNEVGELAGDLLPVIADQIAAKVRSDYSRYVRVLSNQGELLTDEVQALFVQKVKARYRGYLRRHEQILAKEFPDRAKQEDFDKLMAQFERTTDRIIERYYIDEFRPEFERTLALWKEVQPVAPPKPGGAPLEDQLAEYFSDWFVLAFADEAQEQVSLCDKHERTLYAVK